MNRTIGIFAIIILVTVSTFSQFKTQAEQQTSVSRQISQPSPSIQNFLGFLNPDNFLMRHSFAMSYFSIGGKGISLASYTNSMFYKISDPLNVRLDVTLLGSPFSSYSKDHLNNFNRLFISRAQLNYNPWENCSINLQYSQSPYPAWWYDPSYLYPLHRDK